MSDVAALIEIPIYWSAGGGRGWPQDDVIAVLEERFGFPDRPGYIWQWGAPFMINSRGLRPFVITCDERKANIALMVAEDVAYLPDLLPPPCEPPCGYAQRYSGTGDPYLQGIS